MQFVLPRQKVISRVLSKQQSSFHTETAFDLLLVGFGVIPICLEALDCSFRYEFEKVNRNHYVKRGADWTITIER